MEAFIGEETKSLNGYWRTENSGRCTTHAFDEFWSSLWKHVRTSSQALRAALPARTKPPTLHRLNGTPVALEQAQRPPHSMQRVPTIQKRNSCNPMAVVREHERTRSKKEVVLSNHGVIPMASAMRAGRRKLLRRYKPPYVIPNCFKAPALARGLDPVTAHARYTEKRMRSTALALDKKP